MDSNLKIGSKVLIVGHRTSNFNSHGKMDKYIHKIMTIDNPRCMGGCSMVEDNRDWYWIESDFEKEVIV